MIRTILLVVLLASRYESFRLQATRAVRSVTSTAASSGLGANELELFHKNQWELYTQHHVGHWFGIQAGYDADVAEVEDYMYCEVKLDKNKEGTEVKHTNSLVLGEIRADCETCFDSERLKSKEIGTYSLGKLKSRVCANVEVRGPGLTPRGISTEVIFRHDDGRIRVLLAHAPVDYIEIEQVGSVPSAYALRDIVVVRERLNKRPLKTDTNPDIMWVPTHESAFTGAFAGQRQRFSARGVVESETVSFPSLPLCEVIPPEVKSALQSTADNNDNNDHHKIDHSDDGSKTETELYKRVFAGGVLVEAPWIVAAGLEVRARVSWAPCAGQSNAPIVYAADMAWLASTDVMQLPSGNSMLIPPKLTDFYVDTLQKKTT